MRAHAQLAVGHDSGRAAGDADLAFPQSGAKPATTRLAQTGFATGVPCRPKISYRLFSNRIEKTGGV